VGGGDRQIGWEGKRQGIKVDIVLSGAIYGIPVRPCAARQGIASHGDRGIAGSGAGAREGNTLDRIATHYKQVAYQK